MDSVRKEIEETFNMIDRLPTINGHHDFYDQVLNRISESPRQCNSHKQHVMHQFQLIGIILLIMLNIISIGFFINHKPTVTSANETVIQKIAEDFYPNTLPNPLVKQSE